MSAIPATAAEAGLLSCEYCHLLARPAGAGEPGFCPRCGAELSWRRHHSIQYTWALVIAAAICYIPANALPVLNTTTLGSTDSDTIIGGVVFLYTSGSWPLALVVLIASVTDCHKTASYIPSNQSYTKKRQDPDVRAEWFCL